MSPSRQPEPEPRRPGASAPACPHCGSTDVELESAFGSSLMSQQYYCRGCRTIFERIKWEEGSPSDWLET